LNGIGLRRFGFAGEPGLGEEAVDEGGPVLDALSRFLTIAGEPVDVGSGEVAPALR
jgi:hypothetical protein